MWPRHRRDDFGMRTRPAKFRLWADPAKQGFNRVKIADLRITIEEMSLINNDVFPP